MIIKELELTNFRSYERAKFELDPAVTLVVGPNASGKTNLLESLYVLASTKSFRAKERDLIRHEQDHFRVVARGDAEYGLGVSVAGGGIEKRTTRDGIKRPLVDHVGQIQVTLFEPTDMELLSGAPEKRRRYLDFILCQTDQRYLKTLQAYKRVLRQRNALLEGFEIERIRNQIFTWDIQLTELASAIYGQRQELLVAIGSTLPSLYKEIAGEMVAVNIEYLPSVNGERYADEFMDALARNLTHDLAAGFTTIGPHREDFKVRFKDGDITAVASRGEARTLVLAMKLAELNYAEQQSGIRPILLLDDVFSELDHDRRAHLLERLHGHQTIITTTGADVVMREINTPHVIIETGEALHV